LKVQTQATLELGLIEAQHPFCHSIPFGWPFQRDLMYPFFATARRAMKRSKSEVRVPDTKVRKRRIIVTPSSAGEVHRTIRQQPLGVGVATGHYPDPWR